MTTRHHHPPTELERARMKRVLQGVPETKRPAETFSEDVYSELRAMRSEVSALREQLNGRAVAQADEILSRAEAAQLLGVCIESVSKLVRDSGLPCRRVGGNRYRFLKSEVLSWLAARAGE